MPFLHIFLLSWALSISTIFFNAFLQFFVVPGLCLFYLFFPIPSLYIFCKVGHYPFHLICSMLSCSFLLYLGFVYFTSFFQCFLAVFCCTWACLFHLLFPMPSFHFFFC